MATLAPNILRFQQIFRRFGSEVLYLSLSLSLDRARDDILVEPHRKRLQKADVVGENLLIRPVKLCGNELVHVIVAEEVVEICATRRQVTTQQDSSGCPRSREGDGHPMQVSEATRLHSPTHRLCSCHSDKSAVMGWEV